jgi:TPR repeat protein
MYEEGLGVPQDFELAVKWYKLAAQAGDAHAQYNLGAMYDDGRAIREDDKQALKWYRRAAEQGLAPAQHNLGSLYEQGHLVPQDNVRALMWYTLAASPSHDEDGKVDPDRLNALVAQMTPAQVATAQAMVRTCEASRYQECS